MDQNIQIFIKTLSGEAVRLTVATKSLIFELKHQYKEKKALPQDVTQFKFMFKGKELPDAHTVVECGIKQGDQIILMIQQVKSAKGSLALGKSQSANLGAESLETGEEYRKAVNDLVELGFKREDVIQALRQSDKNLRKTLGCLINKEKRIVNRLEDEEASDPDQKQKDDAKILALTESPLVRQLVESIKGSPELWQETLKQMQITNVKIYNDIVDHQQTFLQLMMETSKVDNGQIQEEFEIINGEDAHTISMIQELDPSIPQQEIVRAYVENNKNPHRTIIALKIVRQST